MSGLFGGGDTSDKYIAQSNKQQKKANKKSGKLINKGLRRSRAALDEAEGRLDTGLAPVSLTGTSGLGINIDAAGNVVQQRSAESQGFMDSLTSGMNRDEAAYTDLLNNLRPGFGQVTEARRRAIENARTRALGDLRDSLGRRRLAGSSFANDSVRGLEADFAQQMADADAQSFLDELNATQTLIKDRTSARMKAIEDGLSQINYETSIGANLVGQTRSLMMQNQELLTDLAKTNAALEIDARKAQSGNLTTLAGTMMNNLPDYAKLDAEAQAGAGSAFGTIAGGLIGAYFGGPQGALAGARIGGSALG